MNVVVEPDYGQFYLCRPGAPWTTEDYTDADLNRMIRSVNGFVVVFSFKQFGSTPLELTIVEDRPPDPEPEWQHVVDIGLTPGPGSLEIYSWPDQLVATLPIPSCALRLRCKWGGLDVPDDVWFDNERLSLDVWPSEAAEPKVLRAREG